MKVQVIPVDEEKPIYWAFVSALPNYTLESPEKMAAWVARCIEATVRMIVGGDIEQRSMDTVRSMLVSDILLVDGATPPLNLRAMEMLADLGQPPIPIVSDAVIIGIKETERGYTWIGYGTGE